MCWSQIYENTGMSTTDRSEYKSYVDINNYVIHS